MDETTTRELIDRMDRLEEENGRLRRRGRWWRRGGALAAVLAGVFAFHAPAEGQAGDTITAKKITAESIQLRGPNGKLRGLWNVSRKGTAMFSLLNSNQKICTMLTVDAQGGGSQLIYMSPTGKLLMTIAIDRAGEPALVFNNAQGQTRVSLTTNPTALILNDPRQQRRVFQGVDKQGGGLFEVKDAAGNVLKEIK